LKDAKLREGEKRLMMPDLNKPETWFEGTVHHDPNKGCVLTFLTSTKPLTPDFPSAPRVDILNKLEPLKQLIKTAIDMAWQEFKEDFNEPQDMHPAIREIYRLFNLLADHERTESMKQFWVELRDLICLGLYEDNAYLGRLQWACQQAKFEKFQMSKEDEYWFKTRVDFNHGLT
jgi:hypothetical protein